MAKPKAKSLQEKLGFFDDDLKNPDHDSILKWLDKNTDLVIDSIYNFREWNPSKIQEIKDHALSIKNSETDRLLKQMKEKQKELESEQDSVKENEKRLIVQLEKEKDNNDDTHTPSTWTKQRIETSKEAILKLKSEIPELQKSLDSISSFEGLRDEDIPKRKPPRILSVKWEHTVTNQTYNPSTGYQSTKSIIGFVDMKVEFAYTQLCLVVPEHPEQLSKSMTWGQKERKSRSENQILRHSLLIEVKTKIASLGELFRQLNTYREYEVGDLLVVCPDDTEKETIQNQGFKFYKFEKEKTKPNIE